MPARPSLANIRSAVTAPPASEQPNPLEGLDEHEVALVLAKALAPEFQHPREWFSSAKHLLRRSSDGKGWKNAKLRELAIRLARRGLVHEAPSWDGVAYAMALDRVFEVLRAAHADGRLEPAMRKAWRKPADRYTHGNWSTWGNFVGRARALLVAEQIEAALGFIPSYGRELRDELLEPSTTWAVRLFGRTPDLAWLRAAPLEVLHSYAEGLGVWCREELLRIDHEVRETLVTEFDRRAAVQRSKKRLPDSFVRALVLTEPAAVSQPLVDRLTPKARQGLSVLRAFVDGDLPRAYELGTSFLEASKAKVPRLGDIEGVAYLLACIDAARREQPGAWSRFGAAVDNERLRCAARHHVTYACLAELWDRERGVVLDDITFVAFEHVFQEPRAWDTVLVAGLLATWFEAPEQAGLDYQIEDLAVRSSDATSLDDPDGIIARSFRALARRLEPISESRQPDRGLVDIYAPKPTWSHLVERFETLAERVSSTDASTEFRPYVFWQLDEAAGRELEVSPRLVSSPRSSKGRAVRMRSLLDDAEHADTADRIVAVRHETTLREIESEHGYLGAVSGGREFLTLRTLQALVGHPRVRGPEGQQVSVEIGTPKVVLDGDEKGARISIEPAALRSKLITYAWHGRDRLAIYELDEQTRELCEALEAIPDGRVPREAVERLRPALTKLVGHLRIEGRGTVDLEGRRVAPHTGIDVDLAWKEPTLTVEIGVRPLGPAGARVRPGHGEVELRADEDGELLTTTRDLDAERANLEAVMQGCPELTGLEVDHDGVRFVMGYEGAFALLAELTEAAKKGLLGLGWPRGKPLALPREARSNDFRIEVRNDRPNWLAVDAGLQVDEHEVLSWRVLTQHRLGSGRYVRLDDDRVFALSERIQRQLDALEQLDASTNSGKGRRKAKAGADTEADAVAVPELALTVFDELMGLGGVEGREGAVELVGEVAERHADLEAALSARPRAPRGLKAKLRDYQKEGYRWMARLASAGLGGVLADDMGLGKTVQTLALLLARKDEGPALVVCPTSVGPNWVAEAARFAPQLEMVNVGDVDTVERRTLLEGLGPGQVGVLSYALLSRLDEDIEGLQFATLVFDEAHALKNASSRRTKAAYGIEADFRLGLTGTPIENHLGELWAVMEACVPGLLGDEEWFRRGIARAVESGNERVANYLRALIRPFILRRTKEKVLTELPERTESLLLVEPSPKEKAWYEAQRRVAEDRVREMARDKGLKRGQARIAMLAEIMRLRRGAVDPRLIDDAAPRGAKLDLVVERASELVSAGHQVLVFTQFLDVIRMLEGRLRKKGVRTFELQGATPAAERAKRIEAFQRGEADVFLMSLKAGGIGVNLTAADYVLHVDPWWNPAVEDQATGRAHRMGQTRPVTVYRFCTAGTIEPRILELHEAKRELAEDLLSGMEKSKRLDLDELRDLLTVGA